MGSNAHSFIIALIIEMSSKNGDINARLVLLGDFVTSARLHRLINPVGWCLGAQPTSAKATGKTARRLTPRSSTSSDKSGLRWHRSSLRYGPLE